MNHQPLSPASSTLALNTISPRHAGSLLIGGGALLMVMYALELGYGAQTGQTFMEVDLGQSALALAGALSFALGLALIAAGLLAVSAALPLRGGVLVPLGRALAGIACLAALTHTVLVSGIGGQHILIGGLGIVSVLGNLLAAIVLGSAVLRTPGLSRGIGRLLIAVGLITFPCILVTIPLEAVLPPFVIADLPFPVWGGLFVVLGAMLFRQQPGRAAADV